MMEWALNYPLYTIIIVLCALWVVERMVRSFFDRNKPVVNCDCDCCEDEDDKDHGDDGFSGRQ